MPDVKCAELPINSLLSTRRRSGDWCRQFAAELTAPLSTQVDTETPELTDLLAVQISPPPPPPLIDGGLPGAQSPLYKAFLSSNTCFRVWISLKIRWNHISGKRHCHLHDFAPDNEDFRHPLTLTDSLVDGALFPSKFCSWCLSCRLLEPRKVLMMALVTWWIIVPHSYRCFPWNHFDFDCQLLIAVSRTLAFSFAFVQQQYIIKPVAWKSTTHTCCDNRLADLRSSTEPSSVLHHSTEHLLLLTR